MRGARYDRLPVKAPDTTTATVCQHRAILFDDKRPLRGPAFADTEGNRSQAFWAAGGVLGLVGGLVDPLVDLAAGEHHHQIGLALFIGLDARAIGEIQLLRADVEVIIARVGLQFPLSLSCFQAGVDPWHHLFDQRDRT